MQKIIAIVLIVGGAFLLIMGINASESVFSEISEFFTGEPTDQTMVYLGAGLIGVIAGLFMIGQKKVN